jgi:hypothetical protein
MKIQKFVPFAGLLLLNLNCIFGQYTEVEQITTFSSRIDNPIKVEVMESGDKYLFVAYNRSSYPYQLTIVFRELQNLTPAVINNKFLVLPGRNNLLTLTKKDKERNPYFEYSVSYIIGGPVRKAVLDYPYLIPLCESKSFELFSYSSDQNYYMRDFFKINRGDTICCMRKGYVTATPDMYHESDRISTNKSLEIRHEDGTIMIYENINPDSVFVSTGQTVFPGDFLGVIKDSLNLQVDLYMFQEDGRLKRIPINYYVSEGRTEPFSQKFENIEVKHPMEIITREMTKRELKKYEKPVK